MFDYHVHYWAEYYYSHHCHLLIPRLEQRQQQVKKKRKKAKEYHRAQSCDYYLLSAMKQAHLISVRGVQSEKYSWAVIVFFGQ